MPAREFDRTRPFLRADGESAGLRPREFRNPAMLRQLVRGIYIAADAPVDHATMARAALLAAPRNSVIARHTAARLWGGIVPDDWRTHVTTLRPTPAERAEQSEQRRKVMGGSPGCTRAQRAELDWGRTRIEGLDARVSSNFDSVVTHRGLRLTDPARTFVDLAKDLELVDLVVLGDSLVKAGRVMTRELIDAAARAHRYRRQAVRAASLVRADVDSAPETRLRLLMVLAGLPEPEVNLTFRDPSGTVRRRSDLGYRGARTLVEYDGRQHAESTAQWHRDLVRREEFDEAGWRVLVVTATALWREPRSTLDRIVRTLRARGMTVAVTSDEWQRYFGRWSN